MRAHVGWPEPHRQSTCSSNVLHETAHVPNRSTATTVTSGLAACGAVWPDASARKRLDRELRVVVVVPDYLRGTADSVTSASLRSFFRRNARTVFSCSVPSNGPRRTDFTGREEATGLPGEGRRTDDE